MFYLKHKSLESETKVFYTGDNFFTECAECGDEVNIDLEEFTDCGLLATSVYCAKCTAKKIKEEPHGITENHCQRNDCNRDTHRQCCRSAQI